MSQKIRTSVEIDGSLSASQIANATTDTDKFLVSDGGIVKYRTGAEMLSDLGISAGTASKVQHQVKAGVAINKGKAVYVTGADGTNTIVGLASNATEATSSKTMGLLNATVNVNGFADVITEGLLDGLNTSAATVGDPIWLGTGGNLIYGLANKPYAPNHLVFIGIVTRVNANNGEIFVKVQNGFELDELHDVDIKTNVPINGDILGYNGSLWVNKTIAGWLGYTPANDAQVVKLTGNQTITGEKSFNNNTQLAGLRANNTNIGYGLYVDNSSLGIGAYVSNSGGGRGFFSQNAANSQGSLYVAKNDLGSFGELFIGLYDNVTKFLVDHNGNVTGNSFIKTGGTSAQILAADGSVITAGTGISISGGIISSTVVGGVTSFNTRTGVVTLTSTDVNTALGYTAANDANVVKLTGNQSILGIKSFNHVNGSVENFTTRLNYFFDNGIIRSDVTPLETINNLTSQSIFRVDSTGSVRANSFVKIGGNSTQYLKADGSVSTAMNSRIEVNFIATSGQTTFTTPYEVGQIDVYYNGSKLNPSEFTATNGTTVVLSQAATLNAQISIVKYVAALSTTAIRNETTFTATSGQTTFSVNYTVGQLDVFYNGSKLNVSEFTATNGTSVVLGFACQAGESVVFVSYVNQVSGASGTANRVAKFTGAASLGDSQIFDNGTNVGVGVNNPTSAKLQVSGNNGAAIAYLYNNTGTTGQVFGLAIEAGTNSNDYALSVGSSLGTSYLRVNGLGNLGVGTVNPLTKVHVVGSASTGGVLRIENDQNQGDVNHGIINLVNTRTHAIGNDASIMFSGRDSGGTIHPRTSIGMKVSSSSLAGDLVFNTRNDSNFAERMRITSGGNVGIGTTSPGVSLEVNGLIRSIPVYNNTTATAANLVVSAGGTFERSTSSLKYKKEVRDYDKGLETLLQIRPVYYKGKAESDGDKQFAGLIAEEIHELGLTEFVQYAEDETPDALAYTHMVALLVKSIQEQQAQIKELQDEIISLKNK